MIEENGALSSLEKSTWHRNGLCRSEGATPVWQSLRFISQLCAECLLRVGCCPGGPIVKRVYPYPSKIC